MTHERRFQVLLEWESETNSWITCVPALNYLSDYGPTKDIALARTRDAIIGYLETCAAEGIPVPEESPETELVELRVPAA